jgi:hypothetical protein
LTMLASLTADLIEYDVPSLPRERATLSEKKESCSSSKP